MRIVVLGSAAGGGFPQWNCACRNCDGVRSGRVAAAPRTQTSIAFTADGRAWYLIGASPDLCRQVEACAALWPSRGRESPVRGVFLPNGDADAFLGLYSLREGSGLAVHATRAVRAGIVDGGALHRTLRRTPGQTTWRTLTDGAVVALEAGCTVRVVAVPGKLPVHLTGLVRPSIEDNVGFVLADGRRTVGVFPTVGACTPALRAALEACDVVFFDGTFFRDDELAEVAPWAPSATAMAHWPLSGPGGSLELLSALRGRRILVHINNTNPILDGDSEARRLVGAAGVEVGYDGLELEP